MVVWQLHKGLRMKMSFALILICSSLMLSLAVGASAGPRFNGLVYRPVNDAERKVFIDAYGSTGLLLNHRYFMTAEHSCDANGLLPYERGGGQRPPRFVGVRLVESHIDYDVCIFEISWVANGELPKEIKLPKSIWTQKEQVLEEPLPVREVLYSFGMGHYRRPHYSESSLLDVLPNSNSAQFIMFNLGSESGSSGGPVFRKSDGLLVSLISGPVEGKPHGVYEPEDRSGWVSGPALYEVYEQSAVLQKVFPNGTNIFADSEGNPIVRQNKSYDIYGNVDVIHKQSFSLSSFPKQNAKKERIWKVGDQQWALFNLSLRVVESIDIGNSCESIKRDFGRGESIPELFQRWRTPTEKELSSAIQKGLTDLSTNQVFGAHFIQYSPDQIAVKEELSESVSCNDNYQLIQKGSSLPKWNHGSEDMTGQCLQICIR